MAQRKILLYGQFGEDWWTGEGITAKSFQRELAAANADDDCDEILCCINSPGGSVFEGTAIFNAIIEQNNKADAKPINTRNDGFAYSMGGVVLLAGKNVTGFKNSMILIHNASGLAWGNVAKMRSAIEQLDAIDENFSDILATRLGLTAEESKRQWLDYNDHFLSSSKALELGLLDALEDTESEAVKAVAKSDLSHVLAYFRENYAPRQEERSFWQKMEHKVAAFFPTQKIENKPKLESNPPKNSDDAMKIDAKNTRLLALFGLEAKEGESVVEHQPTAEQLAQLEQNLATAATAQEQTKTLAERDARITELEAEVATLEAGSDAQPTAGAEDDSTKDGPKAETFMSDADMQLKAMREDHDYPPKKSTPKTPQK